MATYIVTYDLRKPGQNYTELIDEIQSLGTYAKVTESLWVVVSGLTAEQIRVKLDLKIDNNDRIFVIKTQREASWRNVLCTDQWLQDNL